VAVDLPQRQQALGLFEDFTAEGDGQSQQEKLNALENLTSDNTSTS